MASVYANVIATDGHALEQRLDALAATVCDADPRTKQQRRADAMGALAAGADRLACECGTPGCPAGGNPAARRAGLLCASGGRAAPWGQVSRKSHSLPSTQRSADSFPLSIPHSNLS